MNRRFFRFAAVIVVAWFVILQGMMINKYFFDQKVHNVSPYGTLLEEYNMYESSGYGYMIWRDEGNSNVAVRIFKGNEEINTIWYTVDEKFDREVNENTGGRTIHNLYHMGKIYIIVEQ
jgi:hypothetical protein